MNQVNSLLFGFFTISGVVATGCFLGFLAVSYMYGNYMASLVDDEDEANEEDLDYEERYYEEFKNLSTQELTDEVLNQLKNKYVQELTPGGEVIMTYNNETESYHYWCNNRSIRYLTLDAVAQKFAIDHNCKAVCVDYNEEYQKAKQAVIDKRNKLLEKNKQETLEKVNQENDKEQDETQDETQEQKPKSVFATFKNYNTKQKQEVVDLTSKPVILPEKTNRFSYRGKISDWIETREKLQENNNNNSSVKNIDFSTFKKMKTT
jgi:hypothetical protein